MAHFAKIGLNNVVQQVIVVHNNELLDENGVEQESRGQKFCQNLLGSEWVQTSYNSSFRKNFAGVGFTYDFDRNAFVPPKPFASWILNEDTCQWQPPTPMPDNEQMYYWDEENLNWRLVVS